MGKGAKAGANAVSNIAGGRAKVVGKRNKGAWGVMAGWAQVAINIWLGDIEEQNQIELRQ